MKGKVSWVLVVIVFCQFCCTSLWFAGNAIIPDLPIKHAILFNLVGTATSMVQFGFIIGTLVFAITMLADRYSPSKVFFICAALGGFVNLGLLYEPVTIPLIYTIRFLTGFFLAGVYPVGMKIAADHFDKELSNNLSLLVGALVVGTALPHFLKWNGTVYGYEVIVIMISLIASLGGLFLYLQVPDGPYRKKSRTIELGAIKEIFGKKEFKQAALGYFGHMWELYAFWTFVPIILAHYTVSNPIAISTSLLSFLIIAIGAIGCIIAGRLSRQYATEAVANGFLISSLTCCVLVMLFWSFSPYFFLPLLFLWGITVIGDSALFSSLVAKHAIPRYKGTALTISTCVGFAITIVSIQLLSWLTSTLHIRYSILILVIGPMLALLNYQYSKVRRSA